MFGCPVHRGVYSQLPIFIFGGRSNSSSYLNDDQRFDGSSISTRNATISAYHCGQTSSAVGRTLYLFGGQTNSGGTKTSAIKKHNLSAVSLEAATLSSPVNNVGSAALGSSCYIFGGVNSYSQTQDTIQKYDLSAVSIVGHLPYAVWDNVAGVMSGNAYVFSAGDAYKWTGLAISTVGSGVFYSNLGRCVAVVNNIAYNMAGQQGTSYQKTIEKFDGTTRTLMSAQLNTAVSYASAAGYVDGKAYIFGGSTSSTAITSSIQKYDPVADSVTSAGVSLSIQKTETNAVTCQY